MKRRHDDIDEAKVFILAWVVISAMTIAAWWQ